MVFNESVIHNDKFKEKQKQIELVFIEPEEDEKNIEHNNARVDAHGKEEQEIIETPVLL